MDWYPDFWKYILNELNADLTDRNLEKIKWIAYHYGQSWIDTYLMNIDMVWDVFHDNEQSGWKGLEFMFPEVKK